MLRQFEDIGLFILGWLLIAAIPAAVLYNLSYDYGYTTGMRDTIDPKNGWQCERIQAEDTTHDQ